MARMHSRKKGKSGSTRAPGPKEKSWVGHDAKVVEQLVVKFSKSGKSASEIGLVLRDTYGIPDIKAIAKKSIGAIIKENKIAKELPDDLIALIKKDIALTKHRETFKKDMTAKRGQQLTESKINRLSRYYKNKGVLVDTWNYDRSKASRLVA